MNILDYSDHSIKKQNIDFFVHLVRIAKADDVICSNELIMLRRIGKKLSFTDPEIDNLIARTVKSDFMPPYKLAERFEQLYEIIKMVLADGNINKNEMRLASGFAAKSGFKENEIPHLLVLLITGIKVGKDWEELFGVYKKEKKY
jgi:uncharacterized tellurite resistance protein B-like protein